MRNYTQPKYNRTKRSQNGTRAALRDEVAEAQGELQEAAWSEGRDAWIAASLQSELESAQQEDADEAADNDDDDSAPAAGITNRGFRVHAVHPMLDNGYRYRAREISGIVHVDEYVAPIGQWVYLGALL